MGYAMMMTNDSLDFFVQWHLTERCNLRCRHCYQEGVSSEELTFSEIRQGVEEIAEMVKAWAEAYEIAFSPSMNVTGGEPFFRSDLFEILETMAEKGFDLFLLSNGILIDRERAERLAGLSVKGVQVSLEGPEEIHESIRGKGSFSASLKGVGHLIAAGIVVTLNMTLSEINAGTIADMMTLTKSLGVNRLGFSRLVPSGKGTGLLPYLLSKEKVRDLYRGIFSRTVEGIEIVTGDPVATQMSNLGNREDLGSVPLGGCAAGLSGLTILSDGSVMPCRRLPVPIGNIREDSLRELWVSSPVLERLRDKSQYQGKCGSCHRWAACRGCRAIAYAYSSIQGEGNYLAEDPQCFL
jgi:radical SAM protein with 4Fe4S-binding SPASM domain